MTTANVATATDTAERIDCWCCGTTYPEPELLRLGRHPEVAVCLGCARYLHRQARAHEAASRPSISDRLRAIARAIRQRR